MPTGARHPLAKDNTSECLSETGHDIPKVISLLETQLAPE